MFCLHPLSLLHMCSSPYPTPIHKKGFSHKPYFPTILHPLPQLFIHPSYTSFIHPTHTIFYPFFTPNSFSPLIPPSSPHDTIRPSWHPFLHLSSIHDTRPVITVHTIIHPFQHPNHPSIPSNINPSPTNPSSVSFHSSSPPCPSIHHFPTLHPSFFHNFLSLYPICIHPQFSLSIPIPLNPSDLIHLHSSLPVPHYSSETPPHILSDPSHLYIPQSLHTFILLSIHPSFHLHPS